MVSSANQPLTRWSLLYKKVRASYGIITCHLYRCQSIPSLFINNNFLRTFRSSCFTTKSTGIRTHSVNFTEGGPLGNLTFNEERRKSILHSRKSIFYIHHGVHFTKLRPENAISIMAPIIFVRDDHIQRSRLYHAFSGAPTRFRKSVQL